MQQWIIQREGVLVTHECRKYSGQLKKSTLHAIVKNFWVIKLMVDCNAYVVFPSWVYGFPGYSEHL